jgi:phage-related protein
MTTFTYAPDYSAQQTVKPRVRIAKFGDGYEQRQADGINTQAQVWALTFANRSNTDTAAITGFLAARGAVEAFTWTPPDSTASIKVVCREWQKTMNRFNLNTISATFEQVFE